MTGFIAPDAWLGVVGGGQLGRMFAHAAQRAGYPVAVLDPDPASPAGGVAQWHLRAAYDDADAVAELATRCAAVTTEFENVPAPVLAALAARRPVAPAAAAVAVCQDRLAEKTALAACGVACVPHTRIASDGDIAAVAWSLFPGILKTARLGYDGKGQRPVSGPVELKLAYDALGAVPCVLERRLALAAELSVVVARGFDGCVVHLPVQENVHHEGILALTRVPARAATDAQRAEAVAIAVRVANALGYVGVLCVELFVLADGRIVANEMAPRPHNSGHHSLDSCDLSQFDLQVRTLVGAPLVPPRQHSPAVMLNLLGDIWLRGGAAGPAETVEPDWPSILELPGAHLHLYGKLEARAGRKMGHLTFTAATADAAEAAARTAAGRLGIGQGITPSLDLAPAGP